MIFGAILSSDQISQSSAEKYDLLRSLMNSKNLSYQEKHYNTLRCGFFLHPNLPVNHEDYYFFDKEKGILVLMSGKIYSREKLENESDPKFVSKLFLQNGPSFVNLLNGDFLILFYLIKENRFYFFRDHLGVQPFAYLIQNDVFFFSSDFLNLSKAFSKRENLNFDFLLSNLIITTHLETPNALVKKLKPGHYLDFNNGDIKEIKYWFPEKIKINNSLTYYETIEKLNLLIYDAIKIRCNQKYCGAAHLSGGLDSSLIATIGRQCFPSQRQFWGFSWSPRKIIKPESNDNDERDFVNAVAQNANIQPFFVDNSIADLHQYVINHFNVLGYFHEEKVREFASEKKVNLILSGWGGDEFLSVADSGINIDLFLNFQWSLFFKRNPLKKPKKLISVLVYKILFPFFGWVDFQTLRAFKDSLKYLKIPFHNNNQAVLKLIFKYRSRKQRQLGYIYFYHLAERCEHWAIQGFRHGVEYRYPLLDHRIIEFILQIPSKNMVNGNQKRVLIREINKGVLPDNVRLNKSKLDYQIIKKNWGQIKELSQLYLSEIGNWKMNPDFSLINFEKLEKDFWIFQKDPNPEKHEVFLRNIVFFKSLHEFTKTYRSLPPESE